MSSFRINPAPTFIGSVQISQVGSEAPGVIHFVFRHKGLKALDEWAARPQQADADGQAIDTAAYLAEVIDGWDVLDAADQPLPFSVSALATLIDNYHHAPVEIYSAYRKAYAEARAKN